MWSQVFPFSWNLCCDFFGPMGCDRNHTAYPPRLGYKSWSFCQVSWKAHSGEASHHVKSLTLLRIPFFKNPKSPREIPVNEMPCEETAGPQSSKAPDLRVKKHPCK